MHRIVSIVTGAFLALLLLAPMANALPPGAVFTEATLESVDGVHLHADILRDGSVPENAKLPVVLTVSPYTLHESGRPSTRFDDFLRESKLLERGYRYVMVTMRSFGESTEGCSDWGGPWEQGDVVAAVKWASTQPWSTGKVALFGKSYDAWTGLMGIANRAKGLSAVIAQEPVFDGYRYLYNNGVRFVNSVATPTSFWTLAQPYCAATYFAEQQDDDPDAAIWQARELIKKSQGARTPLFLTQGFLEQNTKPDGAFDYWNGMRGPRRAWFGQFDHVRGWERDSGGNYLMGRDAFIDEALQFLNGYLKGDATAKRAFESGPRVEVQDSNGRYRAEGKWPPDDAAARQTTLTKGAYTDAGASQSTGPAWPANGVWSFSQPLPRDVHLAGEPVIDADVVTAAPRANLVAHVYDVAPDGTAVLVSRGTRLIRTPGLQAVGLKLYGADWIFVKDHRIAVVLTSADQGWWVHVPTHAPVVVSSSYATLPLLSSARSEFLPGTETSRLRAVKGDTISLPAPFVDAFTTPFNIGPG